MRTRYSKTSWSLFEIAFRPWMRRHVNEVRVAGLDNALECAPDRPLLMCPNHVSWWDGFLIREIHRRVRPDAPFYSIMLESELRSRGFLRFLGGLGLTPGSVASLRDLLRTVERIGREHPDAMIVLFPQGRIYPSHRRPLGFLPGVRAVARALDRAVALPVAIHLEPGNTPAPTAFLSIGSGVPASRVDAGEMEGRVEACIDRILDFVAAFGEEAPDLWPNRFERSHADGGTLNARAFEPVSEWS